MIKILIGIFFVVLVLLSCILILDPGGRIFVEVGGGDELICVNHVKLGYFDYLKGHQVYPSLEKGWGGVRVYPQLNFGDELSVSYHLGQCGEGKPDVLACTMATRAVGRSDCSAYIFPPNIYGNTTILNHDTDEGRHDVLRFAEGIDVVDIGLIRRGDNLHLDFRGEAEVITVLNYFKGDAMAGYALNAIEFADGTSWDVDHVKTVAQYSSEVAGDWHDHSAATSDMVHAGNDIDVVGNHILYGGSRGDILYYHNRYRYSDVGDSALYGYAGDDILYGAEGEDALHGGADDDILYGGAGSDRLYGGTGDDELHGNTVESDYLEGGLGNDIYLFQAGALHCECYLSFSP